MIQKVKEISVWPTSDLGNKTFIYVTITNLIEALYPLQLHGLSLPPKSCSSELGFYHS